ncbi:winged helix-turn-helix domain-containing protein [uncultured Actinomyces sp.]|uniref:winged helix-turn-helix domain-containing protein n=1 Tax=uncultured Actinomyces sp. TaxID=249061 RepID=UPI0028F0BA02|nr:winged helix-turn-helix domain-containing protein [uncultured Actinomyces sp.]
MTLVNTPVSSVRAADDRPTSYEDFLDVLAGLRLSSSRIDIDIDRGQVTLDGSDAGLSAKEHDLLAHLASNADRAVTRDELFASVWADSELGADSRTVDAHIRRLRKKLSILPDLISTVRGQGYRFNSTPAVRVRVTRPVALAA